MITFPITFRFGLIDYTGTVDRIASEKDLTTHYNLTELRPPAEGIAQTFHFAVPGSLTFLQNKDPLLTQAIAVEIKRKIEAMQISLG